MAFTQLVKMQPIKLVTFSTRQIDIVGHPTRQQPRHQSVPPKHKGVKLNGTYSYREIVLPSVAREWFSLPEGGPPFDELSAFHLQWWRVNDLMSLTSWVLMGWHRTIFCSDFTVMMTCHCSTVMTQSLIKSVIFLYGSGLDTATRFFNFFYMAILRGNFFPILN